MGRRGQPEDHGRPATLDRHQDHSLFPPSNPVFHSKCVKPSLLTNTPQLKDSILSQPLNLEASARSATTRSLELATLRTHVRLRLATGSTGRTEVLHGVTTRATTLKKHSVRASRSTKSQLVERQALTASLHDARARTLCEAQSAHLQRGNLQQTDVVRDRAHNHSDLALSALHVSSQRTQTHRRTVGSAHVEASQHHLGELRVRVTSDEAVELRISENASATSYLDQKSEIDVVALGSLSCLVSALAASSNQVNTLGRVRGMKNGQSVRRGKGKKEYHSKLGNLQTSSG